MPELPEVETVRRGLVAAVEGARFEKVEVRRADLRIPFPPRLARRLTGRRVERLTRRAKFLIAELDDGNALLVHLGMSGSFRIEGEAKAVAGEAFHHPRTRLQAHDHVVFHMSSGAAVIFNDPRRFGLMDLVPIAELATCRHLRRLGIEPNAPDLTGPRLAAMFQGRKSSIKAAMIDQRLIAGLGNIYVSEALWRARLSPLRTAGSIAGKRNAARADALAEAIHAVIGDAIRAGGSSLRDHARTDGTLGEFQHHFAVYDREGEPCRRKPPCRGTIRRAAQGGRSTFYCPVCQR